jgi:3-deoxy-manno-octulosonate cytidylyltransferase (CMP-KDO synthetase)
MNIKNRIVAMIPARMESSRFPGKPLAKILDLPMIEHVRRRVSLSSVVDDVCVATCNQEIIDVVEKNGGKAIMTANTHQRCTDRIEEAMQKTDADIVLIVQGDEPLLDPSVLEKLVQPLLDDDNILCANLLSIIHDRNDLMDADIVKAVVDRQGYVLYFSRAQIPFFRVQNNCPMLRQTGLSVFRKQFLHKFSRLSPTPMEIAESVDFLRILEHRYPIYGVVYNRVTIGVDRADDVKIVEDILRNEPLQNNVYRKISKL